VKILVICQHYYPEQFRITDICEELIKCGNSVTVVTGIPNYPIGKIYDGYKYGKKRDEVINGVNVHRCFTIGRRSGVIYRFLNYYSYSFSSTKYVSGLSNDFDVVFVNQLSPVIMATAGVRYKKKYSKKLVLYCLDLWPESLVVGGIKRGSILYKLFHRISEKLYKQADKILISSKSFSTYFKKEFNLENTEYLPQYAESIFTPELCKKEPDDYIDLMFAGNIGTAQRVDTIIKAANLTKEIKNLRWHIVGDGSELDSVKKLTDEYRLNSVIFHGRQPVEKMSKFYSMADAMLVTMQKNNVLSMTLPGKVQTYMAAGKPIIGAINGEAAIVLKNAMCGLCGEAENAEDLANNVKEFIKNISEREHYSANSVSFYDKEFSKQNFFNSIELQLISKN